MAGGQHAAPYSSHPKQPGLKMKLNNEIAGACLNLPSPLFNLRKLLQVLPAANNESMVGQNLSVTRTKIKLYTGKNIAQAYHLKVQPMQFSTLMGYSYEPVKSKKGDM